MKKNYESIISHFDEIYEVSVLGSSVEVLGSVQYHGYGDGPEEEIRTIDYNHHQVAKEVAKKLSYFIGVK